MNGDTQYREYDNGIKVRTASEDDLIELNLNWKDTLAEAEEKYKSHWVSDILGIIIKWYF